MSVKKCGLEGFGEVVRHIDGGMDLVKYHQVAFHPVAKGEVFDIDVLGPGGGFLCVAHGGAAVVVFIQECCGFLGYVEVPKNAADVENRFAGIARSHEFGLRA